MLFRGKMNQEKGSIMAIIGISGGGYLNSRLRRYFSERGHVVVDQGFLFRFQESLKPVEYWLDFLDCESVDFSNRSKIVERLKQVGTKGYVLITPLNDLYDVESERFFEEFVFDKPKDVKAISIRIAELLVLSAAKIHRLPTAVIRQPEVYGPPDDTPSSEFQLLPRGKYYRNIIYVEDLLNYYGELIESGFLPVGALRNIVGDTVNLNQLGELLRQLLDRETHRKVYLRSEVKGIRSSPVLSLARSWPRRTGLKEGWEKTISSFMKEFGS